MVASIAISAQFGGRDAADALLPHFRALKRAALRCPIPDFPFPELAFILRVDGDITSYGAPGLGNLDIDSDGQYLSLDIGITRNARRLLGSDNPANPIASGIEATPALLRKSGKVGAKLDFEALEAALAGFANAYRRELSEI